MSIEVYAKWSNPYGTAWTRLLEFGNADESKISLYFTDLRGVGIAVDSPAHGHKSTHAESIINSYGWYHIVATITETTYSIYVNGVLQSSVSDGYSPPLTTYHHNRIGAAWNNTHEFAGVIGFVKLWRNAALSAAEIVAAFGQRAPTPAPTVSPTTAAPSTSPTVAGQTYSPTPSPTASPTSAPTTRVRNLEPGEQVQMRIGEVWRNAIGQCRRIVRAMRPSSAPTAAPSTISPTAAPSTAPTLGPSTVPQSD
jgi:hypothetical protein